MKKWLKRLFAAAVFQAFFYLAWWWVVIHVSW